MVSGSRLAGAFRAQGVSFGNINGGPNNDGCFMTVTTGVAGMTSTLTNISITNSSCPADGISLSYNTNEASTTVLQNLWLFNVTGTGRGVGFTQTYGSHQATNLWLDVPALLTFSNAPPMTPAFASRMCGQAQCKNKLHLIFSTSVYADSCQGRALRLGGCLDTNCPSGSTIDVSNVFCTGLNGSQTTCLL